MKYNNVENRIWILEKIENQIIKEMNNREQILLSKIENLQGGYSLSEILQEDPVYKNLKEERESFMFLTRDIKEIYELN